MSAQVLLAPGPDVALTVTVRFLQLQHRAVQRRAGVGFEPVAELTAAARSWLTWDEAVECERSFGPLDRSALAVPQTFPVVVPPAGCDTEQIDGGRLVRTRAELHAELTVRTETDDGLRRISLSLRNIGPPPADKDTAIAASLIGTHLIARVSGGDFVSLLEPPASALDAVGRCRQYRCFPVLAGPPGDTSVMLVSPIILYDHPRDRRTERRSTLRLDRDRRDPHAAGDDDDR